MGKGSKLFIGTLWQRNCAVAINDSVSNAAYGSGWNGVTDAAPSKDAVYDKIEAAAAAAAALVSDTAFAGSWNGVTTIAPSKNAVYDQFVAYAATLPTFAHGTYTPTRTLVANADAATANVFSYIRVGAIVHCSGYIDVDPTALATITQIGLTLPIASDLAAVSDLTGVCAAAAVASESGAVFADTTNNRANVHFVALSSSSHSLFIQFQYQVI